MSAEPLRERIATAIGELQDRATALFTGLDRGGAFGEDRWEREGGGGGVSRVLAEGTTFEKAGVNRSTVWGVLPAALAQRLGARTTAADEAAFFVTGLSLVAHPRSPMMATVHLNVRYFEIMDPAGATIDAWFGGGTDLTLTYPFPDDAVHFHRALKSLCDRHHPTFYPRFKTWCDHYFVNSHRGDERRGVGGIFFDHLRAGDSGLDWERLFGFVREVAGVLPEAYGPIVERRRALPYGDRERRLQLLRRGRYAEFNLVHDRGTLFGLQTNARIESVLMSLPPLAAWEYAPTFEPGSFEAKLLAMLEPRDWIGQPTEETTMTVSTGLPTRPLGRTDMAITRVGFGAWAIGGGGWAYGWGSQDDRDSIAAIRHALDRGINWIDTAAVYGLGHSEEVVARALAELPAGTRPYVFTKGGMVWDERNREAPPRMVGDPRSLRREVEASLRRLGVDRIDLYQIHWPPQDGTPLEEYWGTLVELRRQGKIRAAGLSNHNADQLERAERIGHVDSLQPPFSMIERDVAERELPWCETHGTGVIVYSPMQSGLLTGSFTPERAAALGPDDWRSRSPDFRGEGLRRNLELAGALRPIAERRGTAVAAIAVAWTLAWPGVTGAIVGARTPAQVDGWVEAGTLELTDSELDEIAAAIQKSGAGSGPVRPGYRRARAV